MITRQQKLRKIQSLLETLTFVADGLPDYQERLDDIWQRIEIELEDDPDEAEGLKPSPFSRYVIPKPSKN